MIIELIILAGVFLLFIWKTLLSVINWLEAREYNKQSKRLEESFRKAKDGR